MSKTSRYSKSGYVLSFGSNDVVFLNVEVLIHRSANEQFTLEIVKAQIECKEMEFACYLVERLTAEGLHQLNSLIEVKLTEELTPSLYTLFYAGDLLPDDTQIKQAS